ncbi:hypothetical protein [Desertivirga xinjiangensis]|uniref:hypothetical protein n=1 Tax=Desertivirga xinjiangensis TaxID=539206 RepID=UPI00210E6575|nr:hypothetical protein [Pedobacter xinjiangensis]
MNYRSRSNIEDQLIYKAVQELNRVLQIEHFDKKLKDYFQSQIFTQEHGTFLKNLILLLKENGIKYPILIEEKDEIEINFLQLLLIHVLFTKRPEGIKDFGSLQKVLNELTEEYSNILPIEDQWKFLIYLQQYDSRTWRRLIETSNGDWSHLDLMDAALIYLNLSWKDILDYIELIVTNHPNDLGVNYLVKSIVNKVKSESELREQFDFYLKGVTDNESLRRFLPGLLYAVISEDLLLFDQYFNRLTTDTFNAPIEEVLYALASACPKQLEYENSFFQHVNKKVRNGVLSDSGYIKILNLKNYQTREVINYLKTKSATPQSATEVTGIFQYLLNNIDDSYKKEWFLEIARNLMRCVDEENVTYADDLMLEIVEKEISLVYILLSELFNHQICKAFPQNIWVQLVLKDVVLFRNYLTKWFNSDNWSVHTSLLKLSSLNQLDASIFKLSKEELKKLDAAEKGYIAAKIVGYTYSPEHLQSLILSLVSGVKESETGLLTYLYTIFFDYIIYNYRSTLTEIKKLIDSKDTPLHLRHFYQKLNNAYQHYFDQLNKIPDTSEIQPDKVLLDYINFYRQQKFSEEFKKAQKNSFSNYFKTVSLHSNNWAIRRQNEPVHKVSPMGLIQTSHEFPSGEKLATIKNRIISLKLKNDRPLKNKNRSYHFPIQNLLKILSSKSSVVTVPVISPR